MSVSQVCAGGLPRYHRVTLWLYLVNVRGYAANCIAANPGCSDKLKIEAQYILTILDPVHGRSAQTFKVFEWLNILPERAYFMLTRVSFK